ncbi:hypothetical protein [Ruegeria sp. EL01]|jgi:hypothetical protein|uniref:hypothetical protein n=1 Tax=Ruegeria sp. EL01 TaxID=2107578 RepID=UPI000EA81EE3|nr:hypothetical protein [Ruegeria sp. EL01]
MPKRVFGLRGQLVLSDGAALNLSGIGEAVRSRAGYLLAVAGVIAVVAVCAPLILDADEADLRYDRHSIPAHRLDSPNPGDAYAFDHSTGDFFPIKLCKLHMADSYPIAPVRFAGINEWGKGFNDAISQVGQFVGEKILANMNLDDARVVWEYNKIYRSAELNSKLERECLDRVIERVRMPDQSVYIVDMVYFPKDSPDRPELVQLSRSSIIAKDCGAQCVNPTPKHQVLKIGWLTRVKADWELVRIE